MTVGGKQADIRCGQRHDMRLVRTLRFAGEEPFPQKIMPRLTSSWTGHGETSGLRQIIAQMPATARVPQAP